VGAVARGGVRSQIGDIIIIINQIYQGMYNALTRNVVSGVVKRHRVVRGAKDAAWKPLASALCARFQGAFGRAPWTTSSFAR
jgi:hypothetical protein